MKSLLFCIVILLLCLEITAQDKSTGQKKGKITGKVITSGSGEPIEYATVTVYQLGNVKPVNGVISNAKGSFKVDGLAMGYYSITIEFLGYIMVRKDSVLLSASKPVLSLGTIKLQKTEQTLQTVTV